MGVFAGLFGTFLAQLTKEQPEEQEPKNTSSTGQHYNSLN
jgi:hypothetical protein